MTDSTPPIDRPADAASGDALSGDLRFLAERLDALGADERASTPQGLADRIAAATTDHLGSPPVAGRIGFGGAAMWGAGLAAAAALVSAIPLLLSGPPSAPGADGSIASDPGAADPFEAEVERDLETLTYVAALFDDGWSDDAASLGLQADELDAALDNPWAGIDAWAGDETSEGDA